MLQFSQLSLIETWKQKSKYGDKLNELELEHIKHFKETNFQTYTENPK